MVKSTVSSAQSLIEATQAMHREGRPLMERILPISAPPEQWEHYPACDAVSPLSQSRYFYHCHPPEDRGVGEHGHFHLFLPRSLFPDEGYTCAPEDDGSARADVVHLVALAITAQGLPDRLFTTNRWVSDEWMFPAELIAARLKDFDLTGANGDAYVNQWLTAFVALARGEIITLLQQRDAKLEPLGWPGNDHVIEITSAMAVDVQALVESALVNCSEANC